VTGAMDCEHAHLRVYEYLDGELTVWKRRAITRHLDDCPPCAQGFTFEIELRRVIVSKCAEDVPAELKNRIALALGIVESPGPGPD
jgi:mycothiol system anti-sigma-R factor